MGNIMFEKLKASQISLHMSGLYSTLGLGYDKHAELSSTLDAFNIFPGEIRGAADMIAEVA
ncbi:MAG: hypothetical protein ACRYHC_13625, partial [Janthinobacterium lividum]